MQAKKKTVAVVEDEADIRELIRFSLANEGYEVECFGTGGEALTYLETARPDLILLDLMLPEMDGVEVCRRVKDGPETGHIPIMMVTAKTEENDIVAGLNAGADDYLTKPFSTRVLVARVRALLRRERKKDTSWDRPISIHDLRLHPGRFETLVQEKPVDLSLTEFKILSLLAASPGWVFTRYQIVNEVRGDDSIVTDRSIDVHVANLRRKLGKHSEYIQTIRGVGYRFKA